LWINAGPIRNGLGILKEVAKKIFTVDLNVGRSRCAEG
jgi:hypothetical protein